MPELPGCLSAGDTLDDAMDRAREAIDLHVDRMIEDYVHTPAARSLSVLQAETEYPCWVWAVVDVPVER